MVSSPFSPPEALNLAGHLLDARVREGLGDKEALRLDDRSLTYREVQILANRAAQALARARRARGAVSSTGGSRCRVGGYEYVRVAADDSVDPHR